MFGKEKQEELYLPTDDTVDIGKEPLPLDDPVIAEAMMEILKRYRN